MLHQRQYEIRSALVHTCLVTVACSKHLPYSDGANYCCNQLCWGRRPSAVFNDDMGMVGDALRGALGRSEGIRAYTEGRYGEAAHHFRHAGMKGAGARAALDLSFAARSWILCSDLDRAVEDLKRAHAKGKESGQREWSWMPSCLVWSLGRHGNEMIPGCESVIGIPGYERMAYQAVISVDHSDWGPRARLALGALEYNEGNKDEAAAHFRITLKGKSRYARARAAHNFSVILSERGESRKAWMYRLRARLSPSPFMTARK